GKRAPSLSLPQSVFVLRQFPTLQLRRSSVGKSGNFCSPSKRTAWTGPYLDTYNCVFRRRGRVVEGTPLLREHTGQNLYPGFESLRLRQLSNRFSSKNIPNLDWMARVS